MNKEQKKADSIIFWAFFIGMCLGGFAMVTLAAFMSIH